MAKTRRNRDVLIERATTLFASRPAEQMGFNAIAEACEVSMWALRYNFGDTETLFQAIAEHLVGKIEQAAAGRPESAAQTIDALGAQASFLATLFESDSYRDLLILVLRAGRERSWLREAYEDRILAMLAGQVEALVGESGKRRDVPIVMRDGAARRFVKRLETAFALAPLLPAGEPPADEERERLLGDATREAFAATYLFEWAVPAAA